jgi:sugar lactone lactonase YvrE
LLDAPFGAKYNAPPPARARLQGSFTSSGSDEGKKGAPPVRRYFLAVPAIVLLTTFSPARAETVYWTALSHIGRVESDGADNRPLLDGDDAGLPTDVELDRSAGRLYWSNTLGSAGIAIRSVGTDGSNPTTVLQTTGAPAGLALDTRSGTMFWVERDTNRIQAANLDGTGQRTLVQGVMEGRGLEIDPVGNKLYWVEYAAGKLRRADLDGSNVTDVVTSGMTRPFDVDIDPIRGKLYWSELGANDLNFGTGAVFSLDPDGTNVRPIITGLSQPSGIDVDPVAGRLYFVNGLEGDILYSNLDGTGVTPVLTDAGLPQFLVVDTAAVPEPAQLGLISFAALFVLRRRR